MSSNKVLKYFPPIKGLSSEVILIDGEYVKIIWEREEYLNKSGLYNENAFGCCSWDDLLYDERLEHLFSL